MIFMRVTVERLRLWITILAALLLAGIASFFVYARWQVHRVVRDLPGKLGISIQQSTSGYTFSKSEGGHTSFTVHAAKMVQYKNGGHAELHEVTIILYDAKGAQADRIYGDDFDYDPGAQTVRANGEVQIDLQGPAVAGAPSATIPSDVSQSKNIVHVKTSDLIFNQKSGVASTTQHLEFRISGNSGSAQGATFNSRSGVLILGSQVVFNSNMNGNPLVVNAVHAQYDRLSRQLYLLKDQTDYSGSRTTADQSIVYFRPDGSAYRIDSQGHVTTVDEGQKMISQTGRVDLDAKSQPIQAFLDGGVFYIDKEPARTLTGNSNSARLTFGPQSTVRHAEMINAVSVVDSEQLPQPASAQERAKAAVSTTRDLEASQVDVDFAAPPPETASARAQAQAQKSGARPRPLAKSILARGGARLDIHTLYSGTPPQETEVAGDQLFATLRNGVAVSSLRGNGNTKVMMVTPNGVRQTSTGDTLWMTFAEASGTKPLEKEAAQPGSQLEYSEQQGNVRMDQITPAPAAAGHAPKPPPSEVSATAQKATYTASTQLAVLTGNPRIRQANGDLTATTIEIERNTSNSTAMGNVKATYRQGGAGNSGQGGVSFGGSEPVHVIADHAYYDHQKDLTTFYGKQTDARMWQGDDSIVAPVLELSRAEQTLSAHGMTAHGASAAAANAVTAVLTSESGQSPRSHGSAKTPAQPSAQPSVVRINSRTLFYSDAQNKATFRGGVVAEDASGVIRSSLMDVYFTNAPAPENGKTGGPKSNAASNAKQGNAKQVDRIVAQGNVRLEQPGRHGTGQQLVYTAQDGKFVLTGTAAAPPHLLDQARGSVTGASLIFNNRDDSVIVSGGTSRAVTDTRTAK